MKVVGYAWIGFVVFFSLTLLIMGIMGFRIVHTYGRSMTPDINPGDAILFKPIAGEKVRVGDIVYFDRGSKTNLIHRVVRVEDH